MVRDVLCDETPLILRREIYATASLLGGAYVLLHRTRLPDPLVSVATVSLVFGVRLAALHWHLHLSSFRSGDAPPS